jgi:PqqD family protein of HPr-rel-A system
MLSGVAQPNASSDTQSIWRVHPDARLLLRHWATESVVYHGASGSTHRLQQPVGEMLELLQTVSATVDEISERVNLDADDVQHALREMLRLGIAERL